MQARAPGHAWQCTNGGGGASLLFALRFNAQGVADACTTNPTQNTAEPQHYVSPSPLAVSYASNTLNLWNSQPIILHST